MNFKENVTASFSRLKKDMKDLRESLHSWVLLLKHDQSDLKARVYELERKMRILEAEGLAKLQR